ncbi:hypothetical protein KO488_07795 [Poseidonibacter lekithochrous]|uniref:hypothetical protein n=1 Tax=Poseidonibacter TaxID=2321187 RepID=UPI001C099705|nr:MULTISPECIES: hypothetical protein [Poseidonibacter]MBU3014654.1 hypothetical protein [Poseidonibacter lekithochrous]MDO6827952.1 hypothetical protein [Poseidonibacter sp. 1_MG-2023]
MQVYLYARSGHSIGLEATKRCATIANALKEFEPVLCTSDFRAGAFAKDLLGIKKYVNTDVIDEEEYVQTIQNSKHLLTASLQTALESISCGNKPVLFKREDKTYDEELISMLNIPSINSKNFDNIVKEFENIIQNYPKIKNFNNIDLENITNTIKAEIDGYNRLSANY